MFTNSIEQRTIAGSPIHWTDTGELRVGKEVPGGSLDPGKMVSGLAEAAAKRRRPYIRAQRVERVEFARAFDHPLSEGAPFGPIGALRDQLRIA